MIYASTPTNWQDLQIKVAQVFRDLGFRTEVEKKTNLVRGGAEIDVYAVDKTQNPETIYVCECKNWGTLVPQAVVHSFRTVVADAGAHHGLLVSKKGFQKGSYAAAQQTNIKLLTWEEFQEMFEDRWYWSHMIHSLKEERKPLTPYVELINSGIVRLVHNKLTPDQRTVYKDLRKEYEDIESLAFSLEDFKPDLPLSKYMLSDQQWNRLSEEGLLDEVPPLVTTLRNVSGYSDIIEAFALRDLLDALTFHLRRGSRTLDELFGEDS